MVLTLECFATVTVLVLACTGTASAGATNYFSLDSWVAASGPYSSIDFTALPQGTLVTDQYEQLGVNFTDPDGGWVYFTSSFTSDGVGIFGYSMTELTFDTPQHAIGAEALGVWSYRLYSGDTLLFTSQLFSNQINYFEGLTFTSGFDRVQIVNALTGVGAIDNIYFSTVPAPRHSPRSVWRSPAGIASPPRLALPRVHEQHRLQRLRNQAMEPRRDAEERP